MRKIPLCEVYGLLLVLIALILQLLALTTSWWATFSARTDSGKPKENGHYGLWSVCSTKGPHWTEDCDPLDTFFQVPTYLQISAIIGILNILTLLPFGSLWIVQIFRNLFKKPKTLCIVKVSVTCISVIFAVLVATLASVGENGQLEYQIQKGWSFWLQISVIVAEIVLMMVHIVQHCRQGHIRHDPEGIRAETYGNPTFDADSPELSRHSAIAFTESSGHPYNPSANGSSNQANPQTLTYENECYSEHSPNSRRKNNHH